LSKKEQDTAKINNFQDAMKNSNKFKAQDTRIAAWLDHVYSFCNDAVEEWARRSIWRRRSTLYVDGGHNKSMRKSSTNRRTQRWANY
jgi:hypothetical protein